MEEARAPSWSRRQLRGAVGVPQEPFLVLTHAEHRPPIIFWANLLQQGRRIGATGQPCVVLAHHSAEGVQRDKGDRLDNADAKHGRAARR